MVDEEEPKFLESLENVNITTDAGKQFATATWDIPSVWDNSGNYTLTSTHKPGDTFNIGDTTVTYTVRDEAGNMAEAQFVVHVTGDAFLCQCVFSI